MKCVDDFLGVLAREYIFQPYPRIMPASLLLMHSRVIASGLPVAADRTPDNISELLTDS